MERVYQAVLYRHRLLDQWPELKHRSQTPSVNSEVGPKRYYTLSAYSVTVVSRKILHP
jgi:hypothetical protein